MGKGLSSRHFRGMSTFGEPLLQLFFCEWKPNVFFVFFKTAPVFLKKTCPILQSKHQPDPTLNMVRSEKKKPPTPETTSTTCKDRGTASFPSNPTSAGELRLGGEETHHPGSLRKFPKPTFFDAEADVGLQKFCYAFSSPPFFFGCFWNKKNVRGRKQHRNPQPSYLRGGPGEPNIHHLPKKKHPPGRRRNVPFF